MPFAPHEIETKRFVTALRGYQTDEVEAFLRAVAADYRTALEEGTPRAAADVRELIASAMAEAAEIRASAQAEARQVRAAARAQANVKQLRLAAQTHARELRERAEADAAAIRREAEELRDAALREAEAAYAKIAHQADELGRLEQSLWSRVHALEHTVVECRQALSHVSRLEPMQPSSIGSGLATPTLPPVDDLLYRVEAAASLATETNVEVATADLYARSTPGEVSMRMSDGASPLPFVQFESQ
jgi:DivIVA domain-containing protein